ncbi:MAG: hypothetical protein JWM36_1183 [Hyphomicrobiales bacterium]|nr:hypothetical protein [Hyphomicrobiales bacterium]
MRYANRAYGVVSVACLLVDAGGTPVFGRSPGDPIGRLAIRAQPLLQDKPLLAQAGEGGARWVGKLSCRCDQFVERCAVASAKKFDDQRPFVPGLQARGEG